MRLLIKVQKQAHGVVERVLVFACSHDTTVADVTAAVAQLGYHYPKWRLHQHGLELDPNDSSYLVDILEPGNHHLHLVDPPGGIKAQGIGSSWINRANAGRFGFSLL